MVFPEFFLMRAIIILHGMAAALALASAIHLWWLIPQRKQWPRGASLGFLLTLLPTYILGWIAYPPFRVDIRFDLIHTATWMANIFDVKEYLSWGALMAGIAVGIMGLKKEPIPPVYRDMLRHLMTFIIAVITFNIVVGILISNHVTL
jgi:hypothetical protein